MSVYLKMENIRDWLIDLDDHYTAKSIPIHERPLKALEEISFRIYEFKKENSIEQSINLASRSAVPVNLASVEFKMIYDWYTQHYEEEFIYLETEKIPYLVGKEVWPIIIHLLIGNPGNVPINDIIHQAPSKVIKNIEEEFEPYVYLWSDANDFTFNSRDAVRSLRSEQAKAMLISSIGYFKSVSSSMFEIPVNISMPQSAIMSIEMAFKAYFLERNKFTEQELKNKFVHKINLLMDEYLSINPTSELVRVKSCSDGFPDVNDRYTLEKLRIKDLWKIYRITIFIVASLLRDLTNQNCRSRVEKEYPTFKDNEF